MIQNVRPSAWASKVHPERLPVKSCLPILTDNAGGSFTHGQVAEDGATVPAAYSCHCRGAGAFLTVHHDRKKGLFSGIMDDA